MLRKIIRPALRRLLGCSIALHACFVFAQETPLRLEDCAPIPDDRERLACFDRLAAGRTAGKEAARVPPQAQTAPVPPVEAAQPHGDAEEDSSLTRHWELNKENSQPIFTFRPHRDNYLIATYNRHPNDTPYRPFRNLTPKAGNLSEAELAFQLGFKLKLVDDVMDKPLDLWFGYTQQSFWQASNQEASSPFRETNYQPEVMAVFPVDFKLLGLRARFVNFGFVHQSNGQTSTLSRSWNRWYAQAGLERGNFTLLARIWKRVKESREDDDNPDIMDYMGHGDLVGSYRYNGHIFSLLTRYNFHTDKGAAQIGWAFPLASNLKGYLQFFSGYGHSLIDYNYSQQSIGMGVLVAY